MNNYQPAFNAFMKDHFEQAVLDATRAAEGERTYHVELYEDGSYTFRAQSDLGNRYEAEGLVLVIPALNDDDFDASEPTSSYFGNAKEEFTEIYNETLYNRANY